MKRHFVKHIFPIAAAISLGTVFLAGLPSGETTMPGENDNQAILVIQETPKPPVGGESGQNSGIAPQDNFPPNINIKK